MLDNQPMVRSTMSSTSSDSNGTLQRSINRPGSAPKCNSRVTRVAIGMVGAKMDHDSSLMKSNNKSMFLRSQTGDLTARDGNLKTKEVWNWECILTRRL
ncbi:hypothetical protein ACJRO7_017018 [Eucalyptus globulus]|uniref:Uncharacterized protein n=1 Tax=Eucalyptus globulus TaxID=34317 RepID=A0ABD3KV55_EUCGL